jgi:hypothetical protein
MLDRTEAHQALRRLFRSRPVASLHGLFAALDTRSRMSVFRRLRELGYFSSFTHSGRYYTLSDIPRFDDCGLWFSDDVGFSRGGSLKNTVPPLVTGSPAGMTHGELMALLRVRVFNTLRELLDEKRIGRERRGRTHLYVSPDGDRAAEQLARREGLDHPGPDLPTLPSAVVIEVLVEAVRAGRVTPEADDLEERLVTRGVTVTAADVRRVFERYGIRPGKKTAE